MIKHTFLLTEQSWIATGVYFDSADNPIPAAGESSIIHQPDRVIIESIIRIFGDAPQEIKNRYEVLPFSDDTPYVTQWESFNSKLGKLKGQFVIIDDTIFSLYQSDETIYSGTEVLIKTSDNCYQNKGCLFKGPDKISSWTFELKGK